MMDIQPSDLRYFFEVEKTLNISRAAERLNIGQPALSQAIQRLESALGTRLIDRFKTGVKLTPAGRCLLVEGRSALEGWERIKEKIRAVEQEIEGCYSIGCHASVGIYSLPEILAGLLRSFPKLEIKLRHALSREIAEETISFKLDFGLIINPVNHPDLVIKELCKDEVSFWAAKNGLADVLICDPALAQTQILQKKLAKKYKFNRFLHSTSLEVIASLAGKGCGIAVLPKRVAQLHPELEVVDLGIPPVNDRLCLVYRADRRMTAAARVISNTIQRAKI